MIDNDQKAEVPQQGQPKATDKSSLDRLFVAMSHCGGCAFWFLCIALPVPALILGIIGVIACKDAKARREAKAMIIMPVALPVLILLVAAVLGHLADLWACFIWFVDSLIGRE